LKSNAATLLYESNGSWTFGPGEKFARIINE
jgi:hypothetical protein